MALKPHRKVGNGTDISFFMNETAERGIIVTFDTSTVSGSGAAMDDAGAIVAIPSDNQGLPAGLLVNDVVNLDLTRQHLNQHQDEVQVNSKVTVATRGEFVTNQIVAGDLPTAGLLAYFAADGQLSTSAGATGVGRFLSSLDEDGYAKVDINLP